MNDPAYKSDFKDGNVFGDFIILKNDFNTLKAISLDLSNSSLYERMFNWNKLTQDIKAYGEKL